MEETFDISKNILVPEHIKLTEEEKKEVFKQYKIEDSQLPKILVSDAAIQHLKPEIGDVIKIIRKSPTNLENIFYRVVVHG
jgi:DNA-directed RNA polymerase I, II, and III subunit RPABC1